MEIEKKENRNIQINEVIKIIGKRISQVRKESKQKIDKISRILKIRSEFLVAIEEGSIEDLPEEVYLKGFIKSYANYFNLNIDQEMRMISSNYNESKNAKIENSEKITQIRSLPSAKIFVSVFIVFLIVIISWNEYKKDELNSHSLDEEKKEDRSVSHMNINKEINDIRDQAKFNSQGEIIIVEESKIDNTNNIRSQDLPQDFVNLPINKEEAKKVFEKSVIDNKINLEIMILFLDTTWIQIRRIDGSIINSGIFENEEIINIVFDEQNIDYFIDTGNAGGFKLLSNNKELPMLGKLGSVKKNVSLLEYFNKYINMQ